jgi:hypothetical protein
MSITHIYKYNCEICDYKYLQIGWHDPIGDVTRYDFANMHESYRIQKYSYIVVNNSSDKSNFQETILCINCSKHVCSKCVSVLKYSNKSVFQHCIVPFTTDTSSKVLVSDLKCICVSCNQPKTLVAQIVEYIHPIITIDEVQKLPEDLQNLILPIHQSKL